MDQHEQLPRNESSPPDRKRVRRSPAGPEQPQHQQPPMASIFQPQQQGGPGGSQPMAAGMMPRPMSGFPGGQGMPNMANNPAMTMPMGQTMGGPPMGNAMSPGMMNHAGPPGMMNPQLLVGRYYPYVNVPSLTCCYQLQYRQTMHNVHQKNFPHGGLNLIPGGAAPSPSASDQFNTDGPGSRPSTAQFAGPPGGTNRPGQNKPMGAMMPPPSPGMGASKNKDNASADPAAPSVSPQTANAGVGQQGPPPPAGPSTGPPTPNSSSAAMTAPSPSAMGNTAVTSSLATGHGGMATSDPIGSDLLSNDFFQDIAFESSIFRPDDFERDFGEWFNPGQDMQPPV